MADDVFKGELARILGKVNVPGSMYEGWQNPQNQPGDKSPNGVYATPFDRQGGSAVAQNELETQARDILGRMLGQQGYGSEAVDELLQILKGTNQSPADVGPKNGREGGVEKVNYGAGLSAQQVDSVLQSNPNWQKFQAFMSAKEEEDKKREEDDKEKERKAKEDKEMSAFTERIATLIESTVTAKIDQAMSAYGFKPQAQTQSAPTQAAQGESVPSGLSAQGQASGVTNWQSLGGVQMPPGMQVPANNSQMSAENPNQAKADKFLQEAMSVVNGISDPYQRTRVAEDVRPIFAGILAGAPVSINHPMLRKVADTAGVQYTGFGVGGAL